ncbi:MAG: class II fructose-bisphosphate aldolase [Planctomycetota bacterium]|nr:class II fructose-bisphosphate aldolase [Planctomycetota bacterium]
MGLIGTREMLGDAFRGGYAVGGFVAFTAEVMQAVMRESRKRRSPAMIICGPGDYALLGANATAKIAAALADEAGVDVALHLDHADSYEQVVEAIEAGFTSVMIDGSQADFEQNVALTAKVVAFAHDRGIPVEAEIGAIGKVEGAAAEAGGGPRTECTDPASAKEFVERTGCDFLAVSIGNAHGLYAKAPSLRMDLLRDIRQATGIPLVLHGGSGTPEDQLRTVVSLGVSKVNVGSEIARDFNAVYIPMLTERRVWWAEAKQAAAAAVHGTVGRWIDVLGSAGKA